MRASEILEYFGPFSPKEMQRTAGRCHSIDSEMASPTRRAGTKSYRSRGHLCQPLELLQVLKPSSQGDVVTSSCNTNHQGCSRQVDYLSSRTNSSLPKMPPNRQPFRLGNITVHNCPGSPRCWASNKTWY